MQSVSMDIVYKGTGRSQQAGRHGLRHGEGWDIEEQNFICERSVYKESSGGRRK